MQPVHELLSRIRWDPEFGQGTFEIAYDDHLQSRWVHIALSEIDYEGGSSFMFEALNQQGEAISVPLHRIRAVYRDGQLIWLRSTAAARR